MINSKIVEYRRYRTIPKSLHAQVVVVDENGRMWDIVTEKEWKLDQTKWELDLSMSAEQYQKLQAKIAEDAKIAEENKTK